MAIKRRSDTGAEEIVMISPLLEKGLPHSAFVIRMIAEKVIAAWVMPV